MKLKLYAQLLVLLVLVAVLLQSCGEYVGGSDKNIDNKSEENKSTDFIDEITWSEVLKGVSSKMDFPSKYYANWFADKLSISVDEANSNLKFESMLLIENDLYLILSSKSKSESDFCLRACFLLKLQIEETENIYKFYYLQKSAETDQEKVFCEALVRSYLSIVVKNKEPELELFNLDANEGSDTKLICSDAWRDSANLKDAFSSDDLPPTWYCGRIPSFPLFINVESGATYIYYVCVRFGNGGKLVNSIVKLEVLNSAIIPQYENGILINPYMKLRDELHYTDVKMNILGDADLIYLNHE